MSPFALAALVALAALRPNVGADFSTPAKIREHLARTEAALRQAPAPEGLEAQRAKLLDRLHAYWERGVFPQNVTHPAQIPVFIDAQGNACAVAQLVIDSGHEALARRVQATDNNGYLLEMNVPGLAEWIASSGFLATELAMIQPAYAPRPEGCGVWDPRALPEGPVALGYAQADVATGRRACPRTEAGLGGRLGLTIDTPDFYGAVAAQGVLFGSVALRPTTELFTTLEAVSFTFAQNAVLTSTQLTLGNLTFGATQVLWQREGVVLSASARVLLPTSFEVPGARLLGGEVGAAASWRPIRWLEVHGYLGGDLSGAVGRATGYARGGGVLLAGAQLNPWGWGALVVDLTGRLGAVSSLAPTVGLRFKVGPVGLELGATLPVVGNDRHDVIAGLRAGWRFD